MLTSPGILTWLPAVLLLAALTAAGVLAAQSAKNRRITRQAEALLADTRLRLETVLQLNRQLVEARDEKTLVEAALAAVNRLAQGLGVSFVPFDAWGQPLPAFTFGEMPAPVMQAWAEHLVSEQVRSQCSQCQALHSPSGQPCPLKPGPLGNAMTITCLPLSLGMRSLGVVNIYDRPGRALDPNLRAFIEALLNEMALAVETMRLRSRELNALRQTHRLRSPRAGLATTLEAFLDGVRSALEAEGLVIQVRPLADERLSELRVVSGSLEGITDAEVEMAAAQALSAAGPLRLHLSGPAPFCEGFPLTLPEGQVLGALLAFSSRPGGLENRQLSMLQTAAAQAALIIENERLTFSLEYTLVLQERTRLAREIHDGLAQTLAFLKMQTAQMHTALAQNDTGRLSRLLNESRQALTDAYQETRHVIDNLRVHPEECFSSWLEQMARDFEKSSGISVVTSLQVDDPPFLPEVQAQLVRIIQEALTNVRKHAHASQVEIGLREWGGDLLLEIKDDGQGFDPQDIPSVAQYGLRGMRERAEWIGADFQIISQPRQGTTVQISLPVNLEEVGE